jgi:hypothetical protein
MDMSSKKKVEKKKAVYQYIHCDVYKHGVSVFIGDCESLRKWAKKFYNEPQEKDLIQSIEEYCTDENYFENDVAARCYDSDSGQYIVHLPSFSFSYNPLEISNLSHELLHATFLMLDFIGMEYRYQGNNEAYTYLHEYLLKHALIEKDYKKV